MSDAGRGAVNLRSSSRQPEQARRGGAAVNRTIRGPLGIPAEALALDRSIGMLRDMDALLASLVSAYESTRHEGVPWNFNLILFAGGRRYVGRLLTFGEFLGSTDRLLGTVAKGMGVGFPNTEAGSASAAFSGEASCLHMAVNEIQDGEVVFHFEGLNLRFQLDRIEAWTTGAIEG